MSNSQAPAAFGRREQILFAALLIVGVLLRISFPQRMSVEHFDEGVYASNIWFGAEQQHQYPLRFLYSPPLLPSLIEFSVIIDQILQGGQSPPASLATMGPSILAGCCTLFLIWRLTRTWFGPYAGLATLALAGFSEPHILYCRTALTDVLLLCWMVLAFQFMTRAFSTRRTVDLLLCGFLIGLAWWTKYNGWLPLLIGLAALLWQGGLNQLVSPGTSAWQQTAKDLATWLAISVIAFLVWLPFLSSLQESGGYATVLANHRQYVVGLAGWTKSLAQQWANLSLISQSVTSLGFVAAFGVQAVSATAPKDRRTVAMLALLTGGLAIGLGAVNLMVCLSLIGFWHLFRTAHGTDRTAACLVVSWFGLLFLMTPCYTPYPRLTLPWLCAAWVLAGVGVQAVVQKMVNIAAIERLGRLQLPLLIVATVLVAGCFCRQLSRTEGVPWEPRNQLKAAAIAVREQLELEDTDDAAVVFVYGEPAIFFYLSSTGIAAVPGFSTESQIPRLPAGVQAYLLIGLHADRDPSFQKWWAIHQHEFEKVRTFDYTPSTLVALNHRSPLEVSTSGRQPADVQLLRHNP